VIFDLVCTADNGETFLIEVQRSTQRNLKRRMLYYGCKLIADMAPKGGRLGWNYAISEVYIVVLQVYLRRPIFERLFEIVAYTQLNKEERNMYDVSLKCKWDAFSVRETQELDLADEIENGLKQGLSKDCSKV